MENKIKKKPSFIGKINTAFFIFVTFCVIVLGAFSFYQQVQSIREDRKIVLDAFGSIIASTIERPFSLGDYSEVQSLLSVEKLPVFITSIKVLDVNNVERASDERKQLKSCSLEQGLKFPILDGGAVVIELSNCDLKKRFYSLFLKMLILAILVIAISIILGKKLVIWAWQPAKEIISKATDSKTLTRELLDAADDEFKPLLASLLESYRGLSDLEFRDEMIHNFASPVKTLMQILKKSHLNEKDRIAAINSVLQIKSCMKMKSGTEPTNTEGNQTLLDNIIDDVVYEKNVEFSSRSKKIEIIFEDERSDYGCFGKIAHTKLRDILSNMINNSFEAINKKGTVKLKINQLGNFHEISIWDSGQGIKKENMKNIFQKGISLRGGTGVGLSHAKKSMKNIAGDIEVRSEFGSWTEFKIKVPVAPQPDWFISQVDITHIDTVVIVDDEEINFSDWKERKELNVHMLYLSNRESLKKYMDSKDTEKTLFIVDYEFRDQDYKGPDLISEFSLASQAFISTNKLRSPEAYRECAKRGVKIQPKPMISRVPIISRDISVPQAIFIDDDKAISYLVDDLSESFNTKVLAYNDTESFFKEISKFSQNIYCFIDKNLGTVSGVDVARRLRSLGYHNLIAATGSMKTSFTDDEKKLFIGYISKLEDSQEYCTLIHGEKRATW